MSSSQSPPPPLHITTSRHFLSWLAGMRAGIAFTTYQSGKLFLLGVQPNGRLSTFERTLQRVMGMAVHQRDLHLATLYQVWRFADVLEPGQRYQGYDRVYAPRQSFVTGDLDIHDMAVDKNGRLVFVNTLFNCVATLDPDFSFRPIWTPPWISKLAPEDRCHLNGLALRDGEPRYATSVSRSDVADGWRDKRTGSGVVIDLKTNEVVCEGLSMPHSPRWHNGRLWLLNSGTGFFGYVDLETNRFVEVAFTPGFTRGMGLMGNWAVVGLSDRRENRTFHGLPLEENLKSREAETRCGLMVVDLTSGDAPHWVRLEGVVKELYDVAFLPGCTSPMAIGFVSDEVTRMIRVAPAQE